MNRRSLPVWRAFSRIDLAASAALACAVALGGCSVSWRTEHSVSSRSGSGSGGSVPVSSGAERPGRTHEPRRGSNGRDNVERVTVHSRPTPQPSGGSGTGGAGGATGDGQSRPDVPAASGAATGESGSPVPTPESVSPVAPPPVAAPTETNPSENPVAQPPSSKPSDKRPYQDKYAPRQKPIKRTRSVVSTDQPKANRDRTDTPAPTQGKIDRNR